MPSPSAGGMLWAVRTPAPSGEVTLDGNLTLRASGEARVPRSPRSFRRGDVVGRYVMIERVGAGGMGVVYAAYDPDLDRKIALKLLLPSPDGQGADPEATVRLQREAQATARLNHPNVVTVHDVGRLDSGVFIAMEYLEGGTLGQWVDSSDRSLEELLARYVEAGRGLAAAHEAGLVHRDFKPENVLLGSDGRARVADFGLALRHEVEPITEGSSDSLATETSLTRTGVLMGTPAYMSPEQHLGEPADARSDQFSYCVALYEALYGQRPWAGDTIATLCASVLEDAPREQSAEFPSRVRRAIQRGLARDPEQRWPSMDALLAVLSPDPTARRRTWWLAAAGVAVVGIGTAWWLGTRASDKPCTGGAQRLAEVWNPDRAETLTTAMRTTGLTYVEPVVQTVSSELDRYGDAWVEAYTEACRATRVLGEQSELLLDRRVSCLDRRLVALDATVDVLIQADEQTIQRAVKTVGSLPPLRSCSNRDALLAVVPPPEDPDAIAAVANARSSIARAEALIATGHYDEALEVSLLAIEQIDGLDYALIRAEALRSKGRALQERAELQQSVSVLEHGFRLALASGDDELAAHIAAELTYIEGYQRHKGERGRLWSDHAEALAQRVGSPPELVGHVSSSRGALLYEQGQMPESTATYQRSLAALIEAHGDEHELVWSARSNLAGIYGSTGKHELALPLQKEVISAAERLKGPEHPDMALYLTNYAATLTRAKRTSEALEYFTRGLEIQQQRFGPEHPELSAMLSNIGALYYEIGQLDRAEQYIERALRCARNGDDPLIESLALAQMANLLSGRGEHENAIRLYLQVLEVQQSHRGDHPLVATTMINLSLEAGAQEQWEDARRWAEKVLALVERAELSEHPVALRATISLGRALVRSGDPTTGIPLLEQSIERAEARDEVELQAQASFNLAQALVELEGQRSRARKLAESAATLHDRSSHAENAAEVREWIERHLE